MNEKVVFVPRENGPERLLCEAEIHFQDGPLEGMKLVGFSLWKSPDGEVFATLPSRAFAVGGDRRYFDYVRDVEAGFVKVKALKEWILEEYHNQKASGAL